MVPLSSIIAANRFVSCSETWWDLSRWSLIKRIRLIKQTSMPFLVVLEIEKRQYVLQIENKNDNQVKINIKHQCIEIQLWQFNRNQYYFTCNFSSVIKIQQELSSSTLKIIFNKNILVSKENALNVRRSWGCRFLIS